MKITSTKQKGIGLVRGIRTNPEWIEPSTKKSQLSEFQEEHHGSSQIYLEVVKGDQAEEVTWVEEVYPGEVTLEEEVCPGETVPLQTDIGHNLLIGLRLVA